MSQFHFANFVNATSAKLTPQLYEDYVREKNAKKYDSLGSIVKKVHVLLLSLRAVVTACKAIQMIGVCENFSSNHLWFSSCLNHSIHINSESAFRDVDETF